MAERTKTRRTKCEGSIKYVMATYNYEIEGFTPYCFRHKFISVAIRENMLLKDLMTIVGHV